MNPPASSTPARWARPAVDRARSTDPHARLAEVLDALPQGFPRTASGAERRLLQAIFTPEEADLCSELSLTPETPEALARRLGRPREALEAQLRTMWRKGQVASATADHGRGYGLLPFVIGIFERQLPRMDRALAELLQAYLPTWGIAFLAHAQPLLMVLPVESTLEPQHHALPYHRASALLDAGRAFRVGQCVCRTQQRALGLGCASPMETCLGIGDRPDAFDHDPVPGREITREEAQAILRSAEAAGLVHSTNAVARGHTFICNCCRCCCGFLGAARQYAVSRRAFVAHFQVELDCTACTRCLRCVTERCPVNAIVPGPTGLQVVEERCLGCGLCVTTCPGQALRLVSRGRSAADGPPEDAPGWLAERARSRGRVGPGEPDREGRATGVAGSPQGQRRT